MDPTTFLLCWLSSLEQQPGLPLPPYQEYWTVLELRLWEAGSGWMGVIVEVPKHLRWWLKSDDGAHCQEHNRLSTVCEQITQPPCTATVIFDIITNKHSGLKILFQTQSWSGPMRTLVTQALWLHNSSYECSHWSRPWLGLATESLRDLFTFSTNLVDNRLCSCEGGYEIINWFGQ